MICPNCKNNIQDYPDYCPFCGLAFKQQTEQQYDAQGNPIYPTRMAGEEKGEFVDVIFQRRKKFTGCAMAIDVIIDEVPIGTLANGQFFQCRIPCGTRKVVLKSYCSYDSYLVTFQNDCRNMRIEVGVNWGMVSGTLAMYSVTKEFDNQPPIVDNHQESSGLQ